MVVSYRRIGAVGYVTLDNPPVNAMGLAVRLGLLAAVDWAEAEVGLERVIVASAQRAFAAGGDAREFNAPPVEPHLPDVLGRIEACAVPWIAAVQGVALGGGAELMLACRYRIAAPGVQIGLPEVTLGLVPGAGGTQRLPRLIGLAAALDMIASGKPVSAEKAVTMGLIDILDADPVLAAETLPGEALDTAVAVGDMDGPVMDEAAVAAAFAMVGKRSRLQIAPEHAIDMVELTTNTPMDAAMMVERQTFMALRDGAQSKALRHVFFAERGAKRPASLVAEPVAVGHAVVVGGGTMGAGIAYALLNKGIRVTILETDAEGVERAQQNVEKIIAASLKRGLISEAGSVERLAAFGATDDYDAAATAELAIEAAFESMDVKKAVFTKLEAVLPPHAVLATNTSYLDVNQIAGVLADPSRLVGLHFFAPAHIMKLLEIVRGDATSDVALATGFALAKRLGKIPVLAGVCDGFIGNRILARYREAADMLLLENTNPWELDEAMVDFGYAMGPYEAQDMSGLDIAFANRQRNAATRDPKRRYVHISDRMVQEGRLGKKTSVGWYRYPGGGGKVIDPLVEDLCREEAHFAKVTRKALTDDEIRERLLLAMINEAADILAEGIAQSAADIDLVTVHGYGFPRWRGGLMHYADTLGVDAILAKLEVLVAEDPVVWAPSKWIVDCAAAGGTFATYRGK